MRAQPPGGFTTPPRGVIWCGGGCVSRKKIVHEEEGNDRSRYDEQAVMRPGGTRKRNKRFIPSDTSDAESEEEALSNHNIYKPYLEVSEVSDVPDFMSGSSSDV